jgi:hypothetical protein
MWKNDFKSFVKYPIILFDYNPNLSNQQFFSPTISEVMNMRFAIRELLLACGRTDRRTDGAI